MKRHRWITAIPALAICFIGIGLLSLADNTDAADVTGSVTVQKSGLVLNRSTGTFDTTVTVSNESSTPLLEPLKLIVSIDSPQVSLANAAGINEENHPYIQIPLPNGSLTSGQSVRALLKFSNPKQVKFNVSFEVDAELPKAGSLPPDPGSAGEATLLGIDSDGDGVRDDIQRYIALEYPSSEKTRLALTNIAKSYQAMLTVPPNNLQAARVIADQSDRAIRCLAFIMGIDPSITANQKLHAAFLNTIQRYRAYAAFDSQLAGQIFSLPYDLEESCDFDPGSLPN
ncbi:hypothetical protein C8R21_102146 [Nitrosospira multiformis]|uniref:Uncharacterized protein n=1 Tax=Nitrosospira multiformis TaxID=1231 RepID=A0A2T5IH29_9PROT|nr:hypothetical protein [Nitrosospira multiformis]PTQ83143.1 hypothetical protein C8R21_102146 [Nitrosospira multiformis]